MEGKETGDELNHGVTEGTETPGVGASSRLRSSRSQEGPDRGQEPAPTGEDEGEGGTPRGEVRLRAEMAEMERRMVLSHRRALLAENAGRVVPELIAGATVEELEASVEAAAAAYASVRDATLAQVAASARVSATNGARSGEAADLEAMSALEKIAHGLRRE